MKPSPSRGETKVVVYQDFSPPTTPGAHYRLACLTGKQKGNVFYLKANRLVLGRGQQADIQILDENSSRQHAELKKFGANYVLTDLSSHNGVIVNDIKVKQKTLEPGDRVIVGRSVFKYDRVEVSDPAQIEMPGALSPPEAPQSKRGALTGILLLVILFLLFMEPSTPDKKEKRIDVSAGLDSADDALERALRKRQIEKNREMEKDLEIIFKRGLREYRDENYFRALEQFNLALVRSPNNGNAQFYKEKTNQAIDEMIEANFLAAQKHVAATRYDNAVASYCNVIRLLQKHQDDERYQRADELLRELEKSLGKKENAIECL